MKTARKSSIDDAAARLRKIALSAEAGALLGGEESLQAQLGVSRTTIRQVARLLEREGLLRVRRGINGGYFGARPDVNTIEMAVSAYLATLDMDAEDVTAVASVLWVEVIRKAAGAKSHEAKDLVERFHRKVKAMRPDASFGDIVQIEQENR